MWRVLTNGEKAGSGTRGLAVSSNQRPLRNVTTHPRRLLHRRTLGADNRDWKRAVSPFLRTSTRASRGSLDTGEETRGARLRNEHLRMHLPRSEASLEEGASTRSSSILYNRLGRFRLHFLPLHPVVIVVEVHSPPSATFLSSAFAPHSFRAAFHQASLRQTSLGIMKSLSIILALGLVAITKAQDQCAAVAAKVPSCAVRFSLPSPLHSLTTKIH